MFSPTQYLQHIMVLWKSPTFSIAVKYNRGNLYIKQSVFTVHQHFASIWGWRSLCFFSYFWYRWVRGIHQSIWYTKILKIVECSECGSFKLNWMRGGGPFNLWVFHKLDYLKNQQRQRFPFANSHINQLPRLLNQFPKHTVQNSYGLSKRRSGSKMLHQEGLCQGLAPQNLPQADVLRAAGQSSTWTWALRGLALGLAGSALDFVGSAPRPGDSIRPLPLPAPPPQPPRDVPTSTRGFKKLNLSVKVSTMIFAGIWVDSKSFSILQTVRWVFIQYWNKVLEFKDKLRLHLEGGSF